MTRNTQITLFDIPTNLPKGQPISPFTSIVRYVLTYKQLSFKTEWVGLSEIEPTAMQKGAKPTGVRSDGSAKYTCPFIVDETNGSESPVVISDSFDILQYLEKTYYDPERPIFTSTTTQSVDNLAVSSIFKVVTPVTWPITRGGIYQIVPEKEKPQWVKVVFQGQPLEKMILKKGTPEYDEILQKTKGLFEGFAEILKEKEERGIWFSGEKPTYVDFAMLALLNLIRHSSGDGLWAVVAEVDGGRFKRLVEAGSEWAKL